MENPLNGFKIQLEPEERICEIKDRSTEIIQSEILIKNRKKNQIETKGP